MKKFPFIATLGILLAASCSPEKAVEEKNQGNPITEVKFPGGENTSIPYLHHGESGLWMSWIHMLNDSTGQLNYSHSVDGVWDEPRAIVAGSDWFVNWADFPAITENNGNLLTHILQKSSKETFSYDVKLNLLSKGGENWEVGKALHTDNTKTEHGFVSARPYGEDSFFVVWLDGRNTKASAAGGHDGHSTGGAMSIRGAVVAPDGTISQEVELDASTCDCCQTSVAMTDNGPIVVYRDRSEEEIRDIAIVRQVDGEWTSPKIVHHDNWQINGCPVNGPKLAAKGNEVVLAWFTAVNAEPAVNLTFSSDGGATWGAPIRVGGSAALGRVDVELLHKDQAVVSWMETENGNTYLKAMKVENSKEGANPIVITQMDAARNSGFPQMEQVGDQLYFAWTEKGKDGSSIKMASLGVDAF